MVMALPQNAELSLTPKQEEYLAWLLLAPAVRDPKHKEKMAEQLGVHISTLRDWQKKDVFLAKWRESVDHIQNSPERSQRLLDALYEKGVAGDSNSAKLWLQATNQMLPPTVTVQSGKKTADLSDEELDGLIAEIALREQSSRVGLKAVV